ncbi:MAG: hypothetical protein LUF34_07365, partial [Lachnospiraceae bacterium]|nr:hypothetical protein [Lachnospiraceae bacterium]
SYGPAESQEGGIPMGNRRPAVTAQQVYSEKVIQREEDAQVLQVLREIYERNRSRKNRTNVLICGYTFVIFHAILSGDFRSCQFCLVLQGVAAF